MVLTDLLNQTITVQSLDGINWATGEPEWGPPRQVRCRVESRIQLVRKTDNTEAQSTSTVYTEEQIKLDDRVWLPGENTADPNVAHTPINVLGVPDGLGRQYLWTTYL